MTIKGWKCLGNFVAPLNAAPILAARGLLPFRTPICAHLRASAD